ncbi:Aste57867_16212 [Aphanomyces stellatus]|uniref:Aste57867_16212 protein n=1 Tax=Aphanomyces stellatus TaxID=120398 RepID=A0A485L694_9STRA|nr:hypothetical protein As57867_016155 [Aphanomyces stellatus]VFT92990.1 Aste57867_16212 [Aphanomyces stellatus]
MAFPPVVTSRDAIVLIATVYAHSDGDIDMFLDIMETLISSRCLRLRPAKPIVSYNLSFDRTMDDPTAVHKFRFTIEQLKLLTAKFGLPAWVVTPSADKADSLEALAIVCRRLAEPSRLFTVANEFGRSPESCSRIIRAVVGIIADRFKDVVYFNEHLLVERGVQYAAAIQKKSGLSGLRSCVGVIDGTKQYISRPSARKSGGSHENLQRVVVPDGIIVSMYGPVEGRRHDSTVLGMSRILDRIRIHDDLCVWCLYGDPAYGCVECLCCPFPAAPPGSDEAAFNAAMSAVREAVEWSFHLVKGLWPFLAFDKKMQVRKSPIGLHWIVATLLTNCHTCLKVDGNQISMYFEMSPPSIDAYLGITE